ncbi:MAG TPA: endo-1,4-beta-xylanase [Candidatus Udaeobacter sp.]|nr:endo-1,4-beta-xylanase [Candidatus Udaeobacter sp.]
MTLKFASKPAGDPAFAMAGILGMSQAAALPLNRRRLMGLVAATALGAITGGASARAEQLASLKVAASRCGVHYGSDSDVPIETAPARYGQLFAEQCEFYAANLSWASVTPTRGTPDPAREDPNVAFARAHGMKLTGAHLLWHERTPDWFSDLSSQDEARKAIADHIRAMARHYAGEVYSWNVVNEVMNPQEGRADGLRHSPLLAKLGPSFIEFAFREARQANPGVLLAYNDYAVEMDSPDHAARRRTMLRLLESLRSKDAPIDAVGLQSHLKLNGLKFDEGIYRDFLKEIAGMGLKILITELDVLDLRTPSDLRQRDQTVADLYSRYLNVVLDELAVVAVVTWGLSDRYTWLTPHANPSYVRDDGTPMRPLPFDASFNPKPAFYAMLSAFAHAPVRKAA